MTTENLTNEWHQARHHTQRIKDKIVRCLVNNGPIKSLLCLVGELNSAKIEQEHARVLMQDSKK
jgi:hypothetical protein